MTDNHQQEDSISIYWDCQNVPVNPYLARYLSTFAKSRGCLVCQKAYANWRTEKLFFEQRLHELDYDCIDVPITTRNSVDKKLIKDCERDVNLNLSSDIIMLVTGDGDFAPLVRQLKAKGKKVILFAQSVNVSQKLIQLADEYYFVDEKLPELIPEEIKPQTTSVQSHITYNEAIEYLIEAIKIAITKGKRTVLGCIDSLMRRHFRNYEGVSSIYTADGKKFSKFIKFVEAVVKEGKIRMQDKELFLIEAS